MANNTKMNISYTIKAIDKFTAVHKRLSRQLEDLEKQAEQLERVHTLNMDANTSTAESRLDRLEDQAERLDRTHTVDVDADTASASAQLERLIGVAERIEQTLTVDVDADTRQAENQLNRVQRAIAKINNNVVVKLTVQGFSDARRRINKISDLSRDLGEIGQGMGFGAIFAAIAPSLEVLAGGLGAIASAATPAALGIAGLAAVAIPVITKLATKYSDLTDARQKLSEAKTEEEIAKATEKLNTVTARFTETELKAADALDKFNGFFKDFSAQFNEPILTIFIQSLGTAQNLLTLLAPAIQGTANAVSNLLAAFNQNLEAEDMRTFFTWVGETAGPNIEKLLTGVGNFVAGFANLMVAFDPLAQSFLDGFVNMSEAFRDWAAGLEENQAFQDFLDTVQANAPAVLAFFGTLIVFLWNLVVAMAPFATAVMEAMTKVFDAFNNSSEGFKTFVGIALTVIAVLMMIWAPVVILASLFGQFLVPAIGLLWRAFGILVTFIRGPVMAIIATIGRALLAFALTPVGAVILAIIGLAMIIYANWDAISAWTKNVWNNVLPTSVTDGAEKIWKVVSDTWDKIFGKVSAKGSETSSSVATETSSIASSFGSAMPKAESTVDSSFSNMFSSVGNNMGLMQGSVDEGMSGITTGVDSNLVGLEELFSSSMETLNTTTDTSFLDMGTSVADNMGTMETGLSDNWASITDITSNATSDMKSTTQSDFERQTSVVKVNMDIIRRTVTSTWSSILSALRSINLYSVGQNMMQGLANGISSVDVKGAVMRSVRGAVAAAKAELQIHSPSRVFEQIGIYTGEGFIGGMKQMARKVQGASEAIAVASVPNTPAYGNTWNNASTAAVPKPEKEQVAVNVNVASTPVIIDKRILGEIVYETISELNASKANRSRRFGGEPLV